MARLDSFFSKSFNASKCKTLLKLTIPRIKLLRNRREIQIKQMRREIAKLLETGQEATARIRVEHVLREEKMMGAQEIVELFCELIVVRLPIIKAQRECPLDLKEAISSICFAAPRCADLPELQEVQLLFACKYGKEFASAATELMPECGVNRQLVEHLSIQAPAPDAKLKLLKEIAEEHELDWDPRASENDLLKPHEDLLNGSGRFLSGSKVALPKEKHDKTKSNTSGPAPQEHPDSDEDYDIIDFSEIYPKPPIPSSKGTVSVPEMLPFPSSALSDADDQEEQNPFGVNENPSTHPVGNKQFLPFINPPSQPSVSFLVKEENSPPRSVSKTKNDNVELQDVLAAAQAAAETAERAATAARSAASIAELRVNELVKKRTDDEVSDSTYENPFYQPGPEEKAELDLRGSFRDSDSPLTSHPSYDDVKRDFGSSLHSSNVGSHHQPHRLPSMDDETYFAYPNLFSSQGSNQGFHAHSYADSK